MGHESANFGHQAFYGNEQWCPAGIGKGRDQYISIFQTGIFHI